MDPWTCPGCHSGPWAGFDHFCDVLEVRDHELGQAFAAWLGGTTGWDGEFGEVSPPPRAIAGVRGRLLH